MRSTVRWVGFVVLGLLLSSCSWPGTQADEAAHDSAAAFHGFQKGINLYWHVPRSTEQIAPEVERSFDYIEWLGANSVAINIPLYTDGARPTRVYVGDQTPTEGQLTTVIREAKARNMRVMVRPILDEHNIMTTGLNWRGSIRPADPDAWFDSYRAIVRRYAETLQSAGADEFVLGVELVSLQGAKSEWTRIIREVRSRFDGRISYSFNWQPIRADMPFAHYGVDAYTSIPLGDDATVEQLSDALTAWFRTLPKRVLDNLTIQEVGILGVEGIYGSPWLWHTNAPLRFSNQANWFKAMYIAARRVHAEGIYFWMVDSNLDPADADPLTDQPGSFMRRPAEKVIRQEFARG